MKEEIQEKTLPHVECGGKFIKMTMVDTSWVGRCDKCKKFHIGPPDSIPYQFSIRDGKYICGICEKEFPATYIAYSIHWMGRKSCAGIAAGNFRKHLLACHRKRIMKNIIAEATK